MIHYPDHISAVAVLNHWDEGEQTVTCVTLKNARRLSSAEPLAALDLQRLGWQGKVKT
jgi:hypothetical protein